MSRIYMIRHGKPASTWGQSADLDPGLDELGDEQARRARDFLMNLPDPPRRVISSPLRRCRETAAPYARACRVEASIDEAFGEIPTPAGLSMAERPAWLRSAFGGAWSEITGDLDYEDWRRAVGAALLRHPGTAVFSHYVAINAAVSCATGSNRVLAFRPDHCSVTIFEIESGRLRLVEYGRQSETQVL